MFAPRVAKPKATQPQRSTALAQRPSRSAVSQAHLLQRSIGNLAQRGSVTRNEPGAQEKEANSAHTVAQEAAPSWDFSRIPLYPPERMGGLETPSLAPVPRLPIQAKLKVGAVNDPLEHEADRVSEQIMRMPEPRVQRKCACGGTPGPTGECEADAQAEAVVRMSTGAAQLNLADASTRVQRKCASCSEEQKCPHCMEEEQAEHLARKEAGADRSQGGMAAPKAVHDVLRSPGQELGTETREFFEQWFGRSFANVRVHTDGAAAASALEVNALAYTVGEHIVFGAGQYRPAVDDGRLLIAHELTHTIQQGKDQHYLQRWAPCKPARLSLQECPPREPGEKEYAKNGPMVFLKLGRSSDEAGGALIANFDIGSSRIKPNLLNSLYWKEFVRQAVEGGSRLTLVGFTDCQDQDSRTQVRA